MSAPNFEPTEPFTLRLDAEARLKAGSAPPTTGWPVGVDTLGLLHKLASTPGSAVDALKLLHELQVHQVELDLQHEQMEATQRELAEDLARYQGLYEYAPVGYLSLGPQRDVLECNIAGASLFGIGQDEVRGCKLETLVALESRPALLQLLKQLCPGSPGDSCEVNVGTGKSSRKVQIRASVTPGGGSFLLVLIDLTNPGKPDQLI
jgi:PAS domain S-box-containing protein